MMILVFATGRGLFGGESVLSTNDWTKARQEAIDLATSAANKSAIDAYGVIESIGPCEDHDDLDDSIAQATYHLNARPRSDVKEILDNEVRPEMDTAGWTFRDRTLDGNNLPGASLSYLWTKGTALLDVSIEKNSADDDILVINAVSPCGKRGEIESGDVTPDDPWHLAPTVDSPPIREPSGS